jgi:hypothetical protein
MLNMKKGLAIVLAAATALTFAPVAQLAAPVSANAANTVSAKGGVVVSGKDATVNLEKGTYLIGQSGASVTGVTVAAEAGTAKTTSDSSVPGALKSSSLTAIDVSVKDAPFEVTTSGDIKFTVNDDEASANGKITFTIYKASGSSRLNAVASFDDTIDSAKAVVFADPANLSWSMVDGSKVYSLSENESKEVTFAVQDDGKETTNAKEDATYSYSVSSGVISVSDKVAGTPDGTAVIKANSVGEATLTVTAKAKKDTQAGTYLGKKNYETGTTIGTATYKIVVKSTESNVTSFTWKDISDSSKTDYYWDDKGVQTPAPQVRDASKLEKASSVLLDPKVNTSVQLNVTANGAVSYRSEDASVATVDSTGKITALKAGQTIVHVMAQASGNFKYVDIPLTVNVTSQSVDKITVDKDSVDLDLSTSTAANAVKSYQIAAKSAAGKAITYAVVDKEYSDTLGDSQIATVSSTGLVTAGSKDGTVYVKLATATTSDVGGAAKYVKVTVNKLPAADIVLNDINLDLDTHKTVTLPTSNAANASYAYALDDDAANIVCQSYSAKTGNKLTALKTGSGKLTVSVEVTPTTRYTTKEVKVTVVDKIAKKASDLKVTSAKTVALTKGASSQITYTVATGSAVSFESSDPTVATVSGSSIQALKAGTAIITVKTPETDNTLAGSDFVVVTVTEAAVKPAKVTGVKVANKKGAAVSVSWKSQGANVLYRVYKKVGSGKWVAKNVAGNKTTLSVNKGAKVTVKVKAYVKDANGKTTWGPKATKKTFKTDKK